MPPAATTPNAPTSFRFHHSAARRAAQAIMVEGMMTAFRSAAEAREIGEIREMALPRGIEPLFQP